MTRVEEIFQFIRENLIFPLQKDFTQASDLIESGILDEHNFLILAAFLEERFDIRFKDEELLFKNFNSVENIDNILIQKKSEIIRK